MFLLWIHGPIFWIFNHWPLMLMILEKLIKRWRGADPVRVLEVRQLEGDVMSLKMQLSSGKKFKYAAGQYLRLLCPDIDGKEWHPFTITSAPEQSIFSVHIRARRGMDWTSRLNGLLNPGKDKVVRFRHREDRAQLQVCTDNPLNNARGEVCLDETGAAAGRKGASKPVALPQAHPTILVDGPYGSSSEEVFQYKTLILVGAGIGVTPFASIMRSIVMQHKMQKAVYRENGQMFSDDIRVHFFWCCRDRLEFDSFKSLLKDDIRSQSDLHNKFDLNLYMSGEVEVTSNKVQHDIGEYGRWTKLFTGRPNWNRIFKDVRADASPGEHIGVFFCGPTPIAQALKAASRKHSDTVSGGIVKTAQVLKETGVFFDFHKENF